MGGSLEARNLHKTFKLIAVTAHYSKHKFLEEIADISHKDIIWLNWHQIALQIYKTIENDKTLDLETFCFAEDLYHLLVRKKLRKYAGREIINGMQFIVEPPSKLFFDSSTAQYRGDFIGFIESLRNMQVVNSIDEVFYVLK